MGTLSDGSAFRHRAADSITSANSTTGVTIIVARWIRNARCLGPDPA